MLKPLFLVLSLFFFLSASLKIHVDPSNLSNRTRDGSKKAPFASLVSAFQAIDALFTQNSTNTTENLTNLTNLTSSKKKSKAAYLSLEALDADHKIAFILEPSQNYTISDEDLAPWTPENSTGVVEFFNYSLFDTQDYVIEFKAKECKPHKARSYEKYYKKYLKPVVCSTPAIVVESQRFTFVVKADYKISDINLVGEVPYLNTSTTNTSNPYSLFTFSNRNSSLNVTIDFGSCNISGFTSQMELNASNTGFIGFLNGVDYKDNSFDVVMKDVIVSNVFLNNFIVNNNENALAWLGISLKRAKFANVDQAPESVSEAVLFRTGNVVDSKLSIKYCEFSGNLAGSLASVNSNTKFSLKNTVFNSITAPKTSLSSFVTLSTNNSAKIYNVSFVDYSIGKNAIFSFGSDNIAYLAEVYFVNYQYAFAWDPESQGKLLSFEHNNTVAMNDVYVLNNSFANPVHHFSWGNLNRVNLTRIYISENNYMLADNSLFTFEDSNYFHMNNSMIQGLNFINEAILLERSNVFRFRQNNSIELLNNSLTYIVGLGHVVVLGGYNFFYDTLTTCQNIGITVISPDLDNPEENGGYVYAENDNYLGFDNLVLENVTLLSEPSFAIFGYVQANCTVYLLNVSVINEENEQLLWLSGVGNNTFIFDNLILINSEASYLPQAILVAQTTDVIVSIVGSVSVLDYASTPSKGFYFNSTAKQFSFCENGCLTCDENGCASCYSGFQLENGVCQCPVSSLLVFDLCVSCGSHCSACSDLSECDVCEDGFERGPGGTCLLSIDSMIRFGLSSVMVQWTSKSARNFSDVLFTVSNSTIDTMNKRCLVDKSMIVDPETNLSSVVLNISLIVLQQCGKVTEDMNYTYYSFQVNAFDVTKIRSEGYHFAMQRTAEVYNTRIEESHTSWFLWVLALICIALGGVFCYRYYQSNKKKGAQFGKSTGSLTINQEMHLPLRV